MYLRDMSKKTLCVSVEDFLRGSQGTWLVKELLSTGGFTLIYGEPGVGKTFWAIDLVCSVARGVDWRGIPTEKGAGVYIAAEDGTGVRNRLEAYCRANQVDPQNLDLKIIGVGVSMMDTKLVEALTLELESIENLKLVVIDTLAAASPGADENNSAGMSTFVHNCRKIQSKTGANVMVAHHCGKDVTKGARGWSGLKGAADTVIRLDKRSSHFVAVVEKQKNHIGGKKFEFLLEQVDISTPSSTANSCVILHVDSILSPAVINDSGDVQRRVLECFSQIDAEGSGVTHDGLLSRLVGLETPPQQGSRDRRAEKYKRSINSLTNRGALIEQDGFLCLSDHLS